jgi:hypothetical protein
MYLILAAGVLALSQTIVQANQFSLTGRADSLLSVKSLNARPTSDFDGVHMYGPPISDFAKSFSVVTPQSGSGDFSSFTVSKGASTVGVEVDRRSSFLSFTDGRLPAGLTSMPEPATILLLGSGLTGVAAACWKRKRAVK